jgi:hypothetical protein
MTRLLRRLRLWWVERVVDRAFSAQASGQIDKALVAWEGTR